MRKFTYSRQIVTQDGVETFTASEFDSFEEGQKAVEKGIYDRKLQLPKIVNTPAPTNQGSTTFNPTANIKNETGTGAKTE